MHNNQERVLILSSVASMIEQFNMSNISILQSLGYDVEIACNFKTGNSMPQEQIDKFKIMLQKLHIKYYQIDFSRDIFNVRDNIKAYCQVKKLLLDSQKQNIYKFIHCHSPIAGVIGRLAAHKCNTKVLYTAHGFHFYKGAPLHNWLIYYPIERYLSKWTNTLITITQEDYKRAKNFKQEHLKYIPGVGIDIEKFSNSTNNIRLTREKLQIPPDALVLLSVGELNKNKNHCIIIKAISLLNKTNIYYLICGQGEQEQTLINTAKDLGISKNVRLLGYIEQIEKIYQLSDIFILPSKREGLSVALLQAIASGLPCIASNIRGNVDVITSGYNGFLVENSNEYEYAECIEKLTDNILYNRMSKNIQKSSNKYSLSNINVMMKNIYKQM